MSETVPDVIADERELDDLLSEPTEPAVEAMRQCPGDLLLLGVGGKMGPTLGRMVRRADEAAGVSRRIIGVSRFSDPEAERKLQEAGLETLKGDLLDEDFVERLPDAPNVIYMTGMKFGSSGDAGRTWAMNCYVPALVSRRLKGSRIAAFSTGNVYPFVSTQSAGSRETDRPEPVGEYGMSALGRERMFEYFSERDGTPVSLIRLNYACELRYGVLVDVAQKVWRGETVDVTMGHANVIWQGDANAMSLAMLADASSPAFVANVAGPERLSIRAVAEGFGELMGKPVNLSGAEAPTALLSDGSKGYERYGRPRVDAERLMRWIADWIMRGGSLLGKPTHFEVRDGKF